MAMTMTHDKITERRALVADLYTRGFTETQMADVLKVSVDTIRDDMGYAHEAFIAGIESEIPHRRQRHIAALNAQKRKLWQLANDAAAKNDITTTAKCIDGLRKIEVDEARMDGSYVTSVNTVVSGAEFITRSFEKHKRWKQTKNIAG